jgi:predicted enzyme related to lactoylglutathione lyase
LLGVVLVSAFCSRVEAGFPGSNGELLFTVMVTEFSEEQDSFGYLRAVTVAGARDAGFERRIDRSCLGGCLLGASYSPSGRSIAARECGAGKRVWPRDVIVWPVPGSPLSLIEFPADNAARARRFWAELLGVELEPRQDGEGEGWQTHSGAPAVGVHARGRGPGDSFSLPYFAVSDLAKALERVEALGGSVVHPGEAWAICKDSEGSPFGLAQDALGA